MMNTKSALKIKVSEATERKMQAAIDAAELAARQRIVTAVEVRWEADRLDDRLDVLGVPASQRKGTRATVTGSQKLAKGYGHVAYATFVTIERGSKDWFVTEVVRTFNNSVSGTRVTFPFNGEALAVWAAAQRGMIATFTA